METILDEEGNRTVYLDKSTDICVYCEQQYGCPLIECLSLGLVEQTDGIEVTDCTHYVMFDR